MRRQHGARNILNGASRLGPACCCLIIEYVMHGDCVACTISTEEQQKEEEQEEEGEKEGRLQFVKILPANKKQIKADQRQMKLPSRGYTTLKCTFASNTHSHIHSFVRSLTHSFTHSVSQSFIPIRFGACDNKSFLPLVPSPALRCSSPALLSSFAAANFRLKLIERPTR